MGVPDFLEQGLGHGLLDRGGTLFLLVGTHLGTRDPRCASLDAAKGRMGLPRRYGTELACLRTIRPLGEDAMTWSRRTMLAAGRRHRRAAAHLARPLARNPIRRVHSLGWCRFRPAARTDVVARIVSQWLS